MDVVQACAVSCGEAKQLVGATRLRDLPTQHAPIDCALGCWPRTPEPLRRWHAHTPRRCCAGRGYGKPALLRAAAGVVENTVALSIMRGLVEVPSLRLAVVTRGLVIPSPRLVAPTRGLVVPPWRLVIPSLGLVAPKRALVIPSLRPVAPSTRVAHGHRLRARLVLESLRVVARLELAPARRPRRAAAPIVGAGAWTTGPAVAAAVAVLALAAVWPPLPGVRSSAIFVIVTVAVVLAPPPVHLVTAVR